MDRSSSRLPTVQSTAQRFSPFRVVAAPDTVRFTVERLPCDGLPESVPVEIQWMDGLCILASRSQLATTCKGGSGVAGSCAWRSRASRFSFRLMKRLGTWCTKRYDTRLGACAGKHTWFSMEISRGIRSFTTTVFQPWARGYHSLFCRSCLDLPMLEPRVDNVNKCIEFDTRKHISSQLARHDFLHECSRM